MKEKIKKMWNLLNIKIIIHIYIYFLFIWKKINSYLLLFFANSNAYLAIFKQALREIILRFSTTPGTTFNIYLFLINK